MYNLTPYGYNKRRALSRMNSINHFLGDPFFKSLFDINNAFSSGLAGFKVDIKEQDNQYLLEAELPGANQDQIDLSIQEDVLTISYNQNIEKKEEKENYVYSERRTGHLQRSFDLTGIDQNNITADYANGVLSLKLPKAQPEEGKAQRKIMINQKNEQSAGFENHQDSDQEKKQDNQQSA